jgi:O-antigen ligase
MAVSGTGSIRNSNVPYLTAFVFTVIGTQFLTYSGYGEPFFKGQSLGIVFHFLMVPVISLLWLMAPVRDIRITKFRIILVLFAALWVISILKTFSDDGAVNYTFLTVPLFLTLVYVKPPSRREAEKITLISALFFTTTIFAAQIMDMLNFRPFRYSIPVRWLPDLVGGFRWEGMFGDPNNAGFIAAFIFVYGLIVRSRWKWPLIVVGVVVLFVSESRSGIVGAVIGSLTLLALQPRVRGLFSSKWTYGGVMFATASLLAVIVLRVDPTFNGRVGIWSASIDLLRSNLLFGIGTPGFESAAESGAIAYGNSDGHSIVIDTLVRFGLVSFLLVLLLIGLSLWLCWGIKGRDKGASFAILTTFLAGALTYTMGRWSYLSVQELPWLLALFLANGMAMKSRSGEGEQPLLTWEPTAHTENNDPPAPV